MDDVMPLLIAWLPMLAKGAATTALLCVIAMSAGFITGLGVDVLRYSRRPLARLGARAYVSVFRGTPVLAQVLLCYYLPGELGMHLDPFTAAALALTLNSAAYQSLILRRGLDAITPGQLEAAIACGISPWQAARHIRLPQALRLTLPALIGELIDVIKASAVVSVIAITDVMRVGQQLASASYRPLAAYSAVALVYLCLTSLLTLAGRRLELRWGKEAK